MSDMPLRAGHFRVLFSASLGQLIGTCVATIAGIIIPLIQLTVHPELPSWLQGLLGAMDLIGIAVGSMLLGRLSDRYGYLLMFRLCPALMLVASVICALTDSIPVLLIGLFLIGFGIGGEYTLDSDYVSEIMPRRWRFLMVGIAKSACALGNILAAAVALGLIHGFAVAENWPRLMWIVAGVAVIMLLSRIRFYESPRWLFDHGRVKAAEVAAKDFLGPNVVVTAPKAVPPCVKEGRLPKPGWKQIVLTGVPWACEGVGVYGIGVFLPILVMALGIEHVSAGMSGLQHVASSVRVTLWISLLILPGFLLGLWRLSRKASLIKLQVMGFIVCAISLLVLLYAYKSEWAKWISVAAFMMFELFLNIGPHLVTYVLPSRVYPVEDRGTGTGIATAMGKAGAILGVFFIPMLLNLGGVQLVLWISISTMVLGAAVTIAFRGVIASKRASDLNPDGGAKASSGV